jgi:hypothetical protein
MSHITSFFFFHFSCAFKIAHICVIFNAHMPVRAGLNASGDIDCGNCCNKVDKGRPT